MTYVTSAKYSSYSRAYKNHVLAAQKHAHATGESERNVIVGTYCPKDVLVPLYSDPPTDLTATKLQSLTREWTAVILPYLSKDSSEALTQVCSGSWTAAKKRSYRSGSYNKSKVLQKSMEKAVGIISAASDEAERTAGDRTALSVESAVDTATRLEDAINRTLIWAATRFLGPDLDPERNHKETMTAAEEASHILSDAYDSTQQAFTCGTAVWKLPPLLDAQLDHISSELLGSIWDPCIGKKNMNEYLTVGHSDRNVFEALRSFLSAPTAILLLPDHWAATVLDARPDTVSVLPR